MSSLSPRTSLLKNQEGVAALEFAFAAPLLLILMLGGLELENYIKAVRKVQLYASSISEMISQASPPNNQTTTATVNKLDIHFAFDSGMVIFPYVMKDAQRKNLSWFQDITVDFASVQFVQISTSCSGQADQSTCYTAKVLWTSTGTAGSNFRPCVIPQLPTTSATPSRYTLPSNVFGPGSIIAVDIVFNYVPSFGSAIIPTLKIARSVYVQPRYATVINFDSTNNDGIVSLCP